MKDVTFTLYDRNTWPRSSHFDYYTKGFVKSVNSMTVRLDVTHFLAETKKRGLKFFPAFSALTGQLIASIPEMCTNVDKD
ncbi:MAG: chloramphenicol acetyltransferase CAT, partial [Anaerotignum sp.]|nr:chloramphenicol acetyltransferase CAT [Anaerotignum sp.]